MPSETSGGQMMLSTGSGPTGSSTVAAQASNNTVQTTAQNTLNPPGGDPVVAESNNSNNNAVQVNSAAASSSSQPAADVTLPLAPPSNQPSVRQQSGGTITTTTTRDPSMTSIPTAAGHFVKEKKGRFHVLEEKVPAVGATAKAITRQTEQEPVVAFEKGRFKVLQTSSTQQPTQQSRSAPETGNRERTHSGNSVQPLPPTAMPPPQTAVESVTISTPTVTQKKGRFVVTSVQAPAVLTTTVPVQTSSSSTTTVPQNNAVGEERQLPSYSLAPATVMVAPPVGPQQVVYTAETGATYLAQQQPVHTQFHPPVQQVVIHPAHVPPPQTQQQQGPNVGPHITHPAPTVTTHNAATKDFAPAPGEPASSVRPPSGRASSTTTRGASATNSQNGRTQTTSGQSVSGLGKVFHFLEQMRTEVASADKTIKALQSDSKFLKEKNKELEAKLRETEKKLAEEKSLRETAETRNKSLRRKLKAVNNSEEQQNVVDVDASSNKAGRSSSSDSNMIVTDDSGIPASASFGSHNEERSEPKAVLNTIEVTTPSKGFNASSTELPELSSKPPSPRASPKGTMSSIPTHRRTQSREIPMKSSSSLGTPPPSSATGNSGRKSFSSPQLNESRGGIPRSGSGEFVPHDGVAPEAIMTSTFVTMGQPGLVNVATANQDVESMTVPHHPLVQLSPPSTISRASSCQDVQQPGASQDIQQPMFLVSQQSQHDVGDSQGLVQPPQVLSMRASTTVLPIQAVAVTTEVQQIANVPPNGWQNKVSNQFGASTSYPTQGGQPTSQTQAPYGSDPFDELVNRPK